MLRIILYLLNANWLGYPQASCFPNHCFCEAIGNKFVRQPIDSYTNIAYIIVGLIIIAHIIKNRKLINKASINHLSGMVLIIFGVAVILTGIGSFFYHSTFTYAGMQLDDDTMYLIGSFTLLFVLANIRKIDIKRFLILYLIINLFLEVLIWFFPIIRGGVFGILILVSVLTVIYSMRHKTTEELKRSRETKYFFISAILFAIAYFIWFLDYTGVACDPHSIIQGHAIWHILTALAALSFYAYMYMKLEY